MRKQKIFIFEGPDRCGKSEISKYLSQLFKIPYFKNAVDKKAFATDDSNYFQNCVRYAEPFYVDFLKQTKISVIMDRGFLSEIVYSKVFNRSTDYSSLIKLDKMYANLNTYIVFCFRSSYEGWNDDFSPDRINSDVLQKLDIEYRSFLNITHCKVIKLCVDDHNLIRQTNEIIKQIRMYERNNNETL